MATQERKLPFGKIEPNSMKYFLSCGLGGIIGKWPLTLLFRRRLAWYKAKKENVMATD